MRPSGRREQAEQEEGDEVEDREKGEQGEQHAERSETGGIKQRDKHLRPTHADSMQTQQGWRGAYHSLVSVLVVVAGARRQQGSGLLLLSDLVTGEELTELLNAADGDKGGKMRPEGVSEEEGELETGVSAAD